MNEMEFKPKQLVFNVSNFRFENENVERWVNLGVSINTEYVPKISKMKITQINQHEGLLRFEFRLELLPDIGKIMFNGDCIFFSTFLKSTVMILKAKSGSEIRKKNKALLKGLHNFLTRRCLDYAKEIGEKEGIHFDKWDLVLQELGLEHITFKTGKEQILQLKKDKFIPKADPFDIKNFGGFKEFIYYNEKVIPGPNSGKNFDNATFDVKSDLYNKPKILSKKSLLVQYHFVMNIFPEVGHIEFDGQFIFDSFKNEMRYLLENEQKKLTKVLQNVVAKAGIRHSEKIGKKYRLGFSSDVVLKNLGLK